MFGMYDSLRAFLDTGGPVLFFIMVLAFILWTFLLERSAYWLAAHKPKEQRCLTLWQRWKRDNAGWQDDKQMRWNGHALRSALISEVRADASQNVELIKTLIAIAPLLGLLGTVTGMVEVFDVMAYTGSSNARSMAGGVSKATIPTMAGMVVALTGMVFSNLFEQAVKSNVNRLSNRMILD